MLGYVHEVVAAAEMDAAITTRDQVFSRLRTLGLDDFGEILFHMPCSEFPKLSSILPRMASAETQKSWTGQSGYPLVRSTCNFVRSLSYNYSRQTGLQLDDTTILDFGCEYGRIARLMYYFVGTLNLIGVDPWDRSIQECEEAGLGPNFLLSDYLPTSLPTSQIFDLTYAFSVFTHLSQRAALMALATVRGYTKVGGIFCLTIQPPEYWDINRVTSPDEKQRLREQHAHSSFAFKPHNRRPVDGDITYGDKSISFAWFDIQAKGWSRVAVDRSLEDGSQIYVFLKAV